MTLFRIDDRYSDFESSTEHNEKILGSDVYVHSEHGSEKVGNVHALLVNEHDRVRYLVVDSGFWIFGKKVLLPIERCTDDPEQHRIHVNHLTKQHVENLPEYTDKILVDEQYEQQVRASLLPSAVETTAPVEGELAVEQAAVKWVQAESTAIAAPPQAASSGYHLASAVPDAASSTGALANQEQTLQLHEERLVAHKQREKTGEVTITKRIETEDVGTSVPIRKEKVVIEIESVEGATQMRLPDGTLSAGDVGQVDVYQDRVQVCQEPVVRQQINIRKEVEEDVVTAQGVVRRETLDIHEEGEPTVHEVLDSRQN